MIVRPRICSTVRNLFSIRTRFAASRQASAVTAFQSSSRSCFFFDRGRSTAAVCTSASSLSVSLSAPVSSEKNPTFFPLSAIE